MDVKIDAVSDFSLISILSIILAVVELPVYL